MDPKGGYTMKDKVNRKDFFKIVGAAGIGAASMGMIGVGCKKNEANGKNITTGTSKSKYPQIPRRKLGKTNEMVPILSHGIMYNLLDNMIVLKKALEWGISHWDTSHMYAGGNSELGMGKFFKKYPEKRKDIFLVSKASGARTAAEVEKKLQLSLKRMNTTYIDLYYGVHALSDPKQLTPELKKWAENAKKRGVIKHFGFSTHKNMAECLMAASKLDWIDAIMTSWNFRLMQDKKMQKAVDACHKANIGLISMKVMGLPISSDGDKKLTQHFVKKGFSEGQAKLKAVLEDKRFAASCVTMENTALISANAAAALDKTRITQADMKVLREYALGSCSSYCTGCVQHCMAALPEAPIVSDVMRYLMYYNSYGDEARAQELFSEIPLSMRNRLAKLDYTAAERKCPQKLPIGIFMKEALEKLS